VWRWGTPNVACFTVPDPERVCDAVAARGETFVTPTVLDGVPGIRAAFSNWRTTEADVARIAAAIVGAC